MSLGEGTSYYCVFPRPIISAEFVYNLQLIVREITKTDVAVSTVFRSVKHLPKLGIYFGAAWLAWKVVKYFWQET